MKFLYLFTIFFVLNSATGSWLSDIYTGLNEAIDDSKVKEKIEVLGTNIKKVGTEALENLKNEMPNNDWVKVTKEFLENIEFKEVLKENGDEKMEELVEKWNSLLKKLNEMENVEVGTEMYKSVKANLKDLLSTKTFNKWKKQVHNIAKTFKDVLAKKTKDMDLESLKKNVKDWIQPSFMQNKEDIEEEKEMVLDVVKSANKKFREQAEKVGKQIVPIIRMTKEKKETDDAEAKLEKWLENKFTKPHQKSGKSKWELLLQTMPLDKMKKAFKNKNIPLKKVKKQFKKLAKLNKKLLVVKKPMKTLVKMLKPKGTSVPLFVSNEENSNLESLTPKEKKEYEEAESKWEQKVVREAMKLSKKFFGKGEDKKEVVNPAPKVTDDVNEDNGFDEEFDDSDDYDDDDDFMAVQQTKPKLKLTKEFADKLGQEESEWMAMKDKLRSLL